jgi:hypothetical protein
MKKYFLLLFLVSLGARGIAQKIPIHKLIGFAGKEEAVIIEYLEMQGWDHSDFNSADSIVDWKYRTGDNSFLILSY